MLSASELEALQGAGAALHISHSISSFSPSAAAQQVGTSTDGEQQHQQQLYAVGRSPLSSAFHEVLAHGGQADGAAAAEEGQGQSSFTSPTFRVPASARLQYLGLPALKALMGKDSVWLEEALAAAKERGMRRGPSNG